MLKMEGFEHALAVAPQDDLTTVYYTEASPYAYIPVSNRELVMRRLDAPQLMAMNYLGCIWNRKFHPYS